MSVGLKLCILLHNYENLCFCLLKYVFIYLFSMYNYYVITIFLSWILHTYKLCQNLWKLNFQFSSQFYFMFKFTLITSRFYQMKVFSKVSNTHLYINPKKKKKFFYKFYIESCDSTCTLIYKIIYLTNHHVWVMQFNFSKNLFCKSSCLNHAH